MRGLAFCLWSDQPIKPSSGPHAASSPNFCFCVLWPEGWRGLSLKCHEDWWRVCLSVVTLLPVLSLFLSQACLLSALTFCRPCLRGTRRPKCHFKIYSCEHWLLERREGACNQVENKLIWAFIGSPSSLCFFNVHLPLFPSLSAVIASVLWRSFRG